MTDIAKSVAQTAVTVASSVPVGVVAVRIARTVVASQVGATENAADLAGVAAAAAGALATG